MRAGPVSSGGETIDCDASDEIAISPTPVATSGLLTAGIERRRLGFALRYDVGLHTVFDIENRAVRQSSPYLLVHYRVGRSAAAAGTS